MTDKKKGVIDFWSERGFGFITITRSERYYLHVSKIIEAPVPLGDLTGLWAQFNILSSGDPRRLPSAIDVEILSEGGAL